MKSLQKGSEILFGFWKERLGLMKLITLWMHKTTLYRTQVNITNFPLPAMLVCPELLNLAYANLARLTWWIFFTDFFACSVGDKYSQRLYATALFLLSIIQTHYQTVSSQYPERHLCSLPRNFQQYHLACPTSACLSPVHLSSVVLQTHNHLRNASSCMEPRQSRLRTEVPGTMFPAILPLSVWWVICQLSSWQSVPSHLGGSLQDLQLQKETKEFL